MRLICPNCDAQYEVSADAIPEAGRDVQCSACGHTWFQKAEPVAAVIPELVAVPTAPPPAPEPADTALPEPAPLPEPAALTEPEPDDAFAAAVGAAMAAFDPPLPEDLPADPKAAEVEAVDPDDAPPPPHRPAPASRGLDDSMMAVLREEVERETRARAHDEPAIEVQTDLGLETAAVAPVVPRRVVPVGRAAAEVESETTTRPSKGRALLPDIEEINSTLSPMSNPGEPAELAPSAPRRGSFGRGFMLMILLGMIALTVYVTAPRITQRFPAVAGPVNAYVAGVDTLRVKLDGLMEATTSALKD